MDWEVSDCGEVREVISRTLRSLAADGLIEMQRQQIAIIDRAGLKAEADI